MGPDIFGKESARDLALENMPLRQQVMVLQRQTGRMHLLDRDRVFGSGFARRIGAMGIGEVVRAPGSPWQNPYCERLS